MLNSLKMPARRPANLTKVVVIVGPTGNGKSELALKLAKFFDGEIISADSRQFYKGLTIGTNVAPSCGVPRHFIQFLRPEQSYSVAKYKKEALKRIKEITRRGKLPIIEGGTLLYVHSLIDNLEIPPVPAQPRLRAVLEKKSLSSLQAVLKRRDPETYSNIDIQNRRRLIRALEVVEVTGRSFWRQRRKGPALFKPLILGVSIDDIELKKRLKLRALRMIERGLIKEVTGVLKRGYSRDLESLSAIPYRIVIDWLGQSKKASLDQLAEKIAAADWRYSRKQLAWLRRDARIKWVSSFVEARRVVKMTTPTLKTT